MRFNILKIVDNLEVIKKMFYFYTANIFGLMIKAKRVNILPRSI